MSDIAPEVHVIDVDMTVYRTYDAYEKMLGLAVAEGLASRETILSEQARLKAEGKSFQLLDHMVDEMGIPAEEVDALTELFVANEEEDELLFPDAFEFFVALAETETPSLIFTRGGARQQKAKLRASDLWDHPHIITDRADKAAALQDTMRTPDGLYRIKTHVGDDATKVFVARRFVLEEDAEIGVEGIQLPNKAWLVVRKGLDRLRNPSPEVTVVENLEPVTEYIYRTAEATQQ